MHICNVAFARVAVAVFALLAPTAAAWAQAFPDRPITLIVPWPPGGSTDRHLRTLAEIARAHTSARPIDRAEPARRRRHASAPATMALTAKPDGYTIAQYPMGMLRRAAHAEDGVASADRLHFHHRRLRLHVRLHGAQRIRRYKTFNEYIDAARKPSRARSTTARPAPARRRTC